MTDRLKDRIEEFLRERMKAKLQKETENKLGKVELSDEQEKEIVEDAQVIVNSLLEFTRLLPLSYRLAELGKLLEAQGKIPRPCDEPYDEAAVRYFSEIYGLMGNPSGFMQ